MPRPVRKNDRVVVRFTHNSIRFYLGKLGEWNDPIAMSKVDLVCQRIALDIRSGNFKAHDSDELAQLYLDLPKRAIEQSLVDELNRRRATSESSPVDESLLNHLRRFEKPIRSEEDAQAFVQWLIVDRSLSASSIRRYANTLKAVSPLFHNVKLPTIAEPNPQPMTAKEASAIMGWFRSNAAHYADFIEVLFLTGLRPSELIGLRGSDVQHGHIIVASALVSPRRNGVRIRKATKTGKIRKVPLNDRLLAILEPRRFANESQPDALLFVAPCGKPIDDHSLSQRQWRRCLRELGIPHRPLYVTRSSFISHALEQLGDPVKVAKMTHNSRSGIATMYRHYAGVVSDFDLPDLYEL